MTLCILSKRKLYRRVQGVITGFVIFSTQGGKEARWGEDFGEHNFSGQLLILSSIICNIN
jgi:hypothetical protein